jgi:hypothetical protein
MIRVIKAPTPWMKEDVREITIFLAGSIEMGTAVDWQTEVIDELIKTQEQYNQKNVTWLRPITVLSPRRDDWDSTWIQSIKHPQFNQQVTWELDSLERSDYVYMHFDPKTKSPITLLELGLCAPMKRAKLIINCADKFWRKGNVEIMAAKYGCTMVTNFEILHYTLTH